MFFTASLLQRAAPFPEITELADKLAEWNSSQGKYDAVFFGSSKIHSGILPEAFDAAVRARGHAVGSFNFGVDGMAFPESEYLCEKVLAESAVKPRWVFVEVSPVRTRVPPSHRGTLRFLYWHDLPRTLLILKALLHGQDLGLPLTNPQADLGQAPLWSLACDHVALFVRRTLALGEGAPLIEKLLRPEPRRTPPPAAAPRSGASSKTEVRGYRPIPGRLASAPLNEYLAGLETFAQPLQGGDWITEEAYRKLGERIARAGAIPVFVVFPNPRGNRRVFVSESHAGPAEIWAFDKPRDYPRLYLPELRADAVHLNDAGAREFTATLAEKFAERLDAARATGR